MKEIFRFIKSSKKKVATIIAYFVVTTAISVGSAVDQTAPNWITAAFTYTMTWIFFMSFLATGVDPYVKSTKCKRCG